MEDSSNKCLSSCTRQENDVALSYYRFPNKNFLDSDDILPLIKKLALFCNTSILDYGPKRRLLDAQYPKLCPILDLIAPEKQETFVVYDFYQSTNFNETTFAELRQELMNYASENLIKMNAFLDSPYLSKYLTDEVNRIMLCFISNSLFR